MPGAIEEMEATDKTLVLAANEAFYQAFRDRQIKAMTLVWWQGNGSTCIHPGGQIIMGWQKIRDSWDQIFQYTEHLEIDTETITAEIGDRIAYVVLIENVLQINQGRKLKALSMATNIFEKMAQKWYLIHHHGSPLMR